MMRIRSVVALIAICALVKAMGMENDGFETITRDDKGKRIDHQGTCGADVQWRLENGVLTIEGKGEMQEYSYTHSHPPWFDYVSDIVSIVIEDSVTSIGESAFRDCSFATSVTITNSVERIGHQAFHSCSSLTSISLPYHLTVIGQEAFASCTGLQSIVIPNGVSSIGRAAFTSCSGLNSVVFATEISSLEADTFRGCTSLETISIPYGVTSIGNNCFSGCGSLTRVAIPNTVITIGSSAFSDCSSLVDVTIPESVTDIGKDAFSNCQKLKFVFYLGSDEILTDAFSGCEALDSICVSPDYNNASSFCGKEVNETSDTCTDFRKLFNHCYLGTYTGERLIQQKRKNATEWESQVHTCAKYKCDNRTGPLSWSECGDEFSWSYSEGQLKIKGTGEMPEFVVFPWESYRVLIDTIQIAEGITTIGNHAFENCSSLRRVLIPGSVSSINEFSFHNCSSLTYIVIPESVVSIGTCAFQNCGNLQSVFYQGTHVMSMPDVFDKCLSLDSICVNPEYNSPTFCDSAVTPDSSTCSTFKEFFNQCYQGLFIDGKFTHQVRKNATEWMRQSNGCTEYLCDFNDGPQIKSVCTSTGGVRYICVSDGCLEEKPFTDKTVSIEIELQGGTKTTDMNITELVDTLASKSGINSEDFVIGWESDKQGNIIRVIVYVKDEGIANLIIEAVNNISQTETGQKCEFGIICRAKSIRMINGNNDISGASKVLALISIIVGNGLICSLAWSSF